MATVLDVLLLPLAVLVVLFEDVLWRAAQSLLRGLERTPPLRASHIWIASLPAFAVLPLFLVPEGISHAAGFASAYLLAQGKLVAAISLLVLVKGSATLAVVWIYQAASPKLLAVPWFAWMHRAVQFVRDWAQSQVAPLRYALRGRFNGSAKITARIVRRFRTLRLRLDSLFRGRRMMF